MISPSPGLAGRAATATFVACCVILAFLLVAAVRNVLFLAFGGLLFAVGVRAAAEWLGPRLKLSIGWAVVLVVLALLGLTMGLWALLLPSIEREVAELQQTLPGSFERLRAYLAGSGWGQRLLPVMEQAQTAVPDASKALSTALDVASGVLGALGSGVLLLAIGLYLAADPTAHVEGLLTLVPVSARGHARSIVEKMGQTLRKWLVGQFAAMTIVGILTAVGLAVIGVPMAAPLGLLAALLDFIPNFGPFLAGFPAVLLALTVSPMTALYVVLLYLVIQQIEGNLITPLIQERETSLPPVVTLVTQVVFGLVAGPLGLVFATPLAAIGMVLVRELIALRDGTPTAPSAAPE
jgi:predicted PurR-regulated permease PerM